MGSASLAPTLATLAPPCTVLVTGTSSVPVYHTASGMHRRAATQVVQSIRGNPSTLLQTWPPATSHLPLGAQTAMLGGDGPPTSIPVTTQPMTRQSATMPPSSEITPPNQATTALAPRVTLACAPGVIPSSNPWIGNHPHSMLQSEPIGIGTYRTSRIAVS